MTRGIIEREADFLFSRETGIRNEKVLLYSADIDGPFSNIEIDIFFSFHFFSII